MGTLRRCCGRGRAASSEQPALALFVVWRLANARRCRTSEPVACGLAAGMRRRRTCRRSSPSIKPLGRVVGGVGRSNLDRLRVRGRCAQCANPGAGSAEPLPPLPPARAAVRWRDGVAVPWRPTRQRAATKDATRREVSVRGGNVNSHLGRGSLLVWCVPWWKGAPCRVQGWISQTLVHTSTSAPCSAGEPSWRWPQGRCHVPRA